eukprot:1160141-Pelagomonas_calceolata.AAC.11
MGFSVLLHIKLSSLHWPNTEAQASDSLFEEHDRWGTMGSTGVGSAIDTEVEEPCVCSDSYCCGTKLVNKASNLYRAPCQCLQSFAIH